MDGDAAYLALNVAINVLPALIERRRSEDVVRTRLRRVWAILLVLGQLPLTVWSVVIRGYSNAAVSLVAASTLILGSSLLVLMDVRVDPGTVGTTGKVYLARPLFKGVRGTGPRRALPSRGYLTICVVVALWLALPLRFAGVLDSTPVALITPHQFDPLRQLQSIHTGQCIEDNREPEPSNTTVPCSHPHDVEVVQVLNPGQHCTSRSEYGHPGLNLEVVKIGEDTSGFRGKVYCVVRSTDPAFKLRQRIVLPPTG